MHYTIFLPFRTSCFIPDQFSLIIDKVDIIAKEGHDVDLVYCDGESVNVCFYNLHSDKNVCKKCKCLTRYLLKQLPASKHIKLLSVADLIDYPQEYYDKLEFQYSSVKEIKALEYKHCQIGYAALSDYLSMSRNLFPLINEQFVSFFNPLLQTTAKITDAVLKVMESIKPDVIGMFNSRNIFSRPIADLCKYHQVPFIAYEAGFDSNNFVLRKEFINSDVHDIEYNTKMIHKLWDSSNIPYEERVRISSDFFEKRRQNIACSDKVYTAKQISGLLPENWDDTKHNIVIFNSSEDEMAGLGEKFDKMNLFSSQYQGIKYLCNRFKDNQDIHFYLRIHPNLKDIPYAYHKRLYDFDNISNVTIIPGNSEISTYTLIDKADKVITFGSTTGIEAVYAHKPVILLGCCHYYYLDVAYTPHSCEELDKLIIDMELPPKDVLGALKLSYYRMNNEFDRINLFLDHHKINVSLFNHKFTLTSFQVKNKWWSRYLILFYEMLTKYAWMKSDRSFPTQEQAIDKVEL